MAASAWVIFNSAKRYLMTGDIDLNASTFRMTLHTSASNVVTSAAAITVIGSVTTPVSSGNGYNSTGKALTYTWSTGSGASEMRFDATAVIWTATGGNIANIKYAVISVTGGKLLCYSQLTTSQFTLSSASTLTVTPSANGIFELN